LATSAWLAGADPCPAPHHPAPAPSSWCSGGCEASCDNGCGFKGRLRAWFHHRNNDCCETTNNDCCDAGCGGGLRDRLRACFHRDRCEDSCSGSCGATTTTCNDCCEDRPGFCARLKEKMHGWFHRRDDCCPDTTCATADCYGPTMAPAPGHAHPKAEPIPAPKGAPEAPKKMPTTASAPEAKPVEILIRPPAPARTLSLEPQSLRSY
jgi:hypothetical protein